jgi:ATP-dependent protease ClpP protease subunit
VTLNEKRILSLQKNNANMAKNKKGTVALYGEISSWSDENSAIGFIKRLKEAAVGNDSVEILIHCVGGEVFEGNMICNAIASLGVPVDARIEGICASMASIVITYCRRVEMAENANLMIHAPSSWCSGNAEVHEKAAKLLRNLEKNALKALVKKTGKTEEEVKKWFVGDNWFSAQEALDNHIVDEITGVIRQPEEIISEQELKKTDYNTLYKAYKAVAVKQEINNVNNINNNKTEKKMDKQSLIDRFKLTGVTAQSSDADIEAAIEARMKADRDSLAAMKKQQIEDTVSAAVTAKKITEAQKATYVTIGETSGIETLKAAFDGMKVNEPDATRATIIDALKNVGKPSSDRSAWDWDKWQKEDPRGLEKMQKEDADAFKALYEAKYY